MPLRKFIFAAPASAVLLLGSVTAGAQNAGQSSGGMPMAHPAAIVAQGKSPELKAMARKIMADQQKEIAQLDKWLVSRK